jgi:hypothetical protein
MRWKEAYAHRHVPANQSTPPVETTGTAIFQIENARIGAELAGMKALLDAERQRAETAERDRDRWHAAFLSLPRPDAEGRGGLFGLFSKKKSNV